MPYNWENFGPGPLDLLTPLAEGEKQGTQQAYRQDQIKVEADREADMKARLGLDAQAQQFQQNVWASQADMRSTQLDLAKTSLANQTLQYNNVNDDQAALLPWTHDLNQAAASGDFKTVLNAPLPELKTPQAMMAAEQTRHSLMTTGAGQAAAAQLNAQLALTAVGAQTQADQMKQIAAIPNVDPKSYYNPDGSWNTGKAAADINQFNVITEQQKAQNSATVYAAQEKANAAMYGADARTNQKNAALDLGTLSKQYIESMRDLNRLQNNPNAKASDIATAQQKAQQMEAQYNAAQNGGQATAPATAPAGSQGATPAPAAPPTSPALPWLQSLQSGGQ